MDVTAKRKSGGSVKATYNFGTTLADLVKQFGEPVVYNHAMGAFKVAFQGWLRGQMDQKKTQEQIDTSAKDWKPGQRKQGLSPVEKLRKQMADMSPEDRAALLKEFKSAAGATTGKAA